MEVMEMLRRMRGRRNEQRGDGEQSVESYQSVIPYAEVQSVTKPTCITLRQKICFVVVALLVSILGVSRMGSLRPSLAYAAGPPALAGRVIDPQGEPVRGAEVAAYLNNAEEPTVVGESQPDGVFVLDLPDDAIDSLRVEIERSHFKTTTWTAEADQLDQLGQGHTLRLPDITLERRLTLGFWIATLTFVAILLLIALEKLHNTMAALLGVAVVLGTSFVGGAIRPDLFIFDFERAIEYVNFDVIFLVMGMMIVIGVIEETGIFQWLAYQAYRLSGGRAWLLVIILMIITAVASALLDNVTTMLLMTPMTIQIALAVGVNPLSLLMPEVLASNVGGISTLIGTPTNILIGSYAGFTFNDFLVNLTPGVVLSLVALTIYVLVYYRQQLLTRGGELSEALLERLQESGRITQPQKLTKAGIVFAVMLIFFVIGERIHLVPAVTAILGAVAMLMWVTPDIEGMLKVVDWTTLMFFIALFILVGAIQEVGLISFIAAGIKAVVGENLSVALLVLVWAGAILSGVIANIPFTAAMLPVVGFLTRTLPGAGSKVLFYGLSVGSAMGGNSSLIGASANLVTAGIAERAGYPITYKDFIKVGLPAMIVTVIAGTLWLFIRF
jgi:Na+/H+ antiporter NhaD/arsenite permease-like protein